jgi:hypothetical protein
MMTAERKSLGGRNRVLAILGGATVLFGILAGLALFQRAEESGPQSEPQPLFPGLTARINDLGEIAVTTKTMSFHVRSTDQGWVVVEKNAFPADFSIIRTTAVGVASLETLSAMTATPELHARLGLGAPDAGGDAVRIALADRAGQPMADVLVSTTPQRPEPDGRNRLYVRRSNENQSWLARTNLMLRTELADWLAKNVVAITRDRIQSVTVTPTTGPAYTVSRASADDVDYTLANMPAQRELSFPGSANSVALALVDFTFDDVAPAGDIDFARAVQHSTKTFDGLTVTVRVADKDGQHWASVAAQADNPEKQMEAAAINAKVTGRAFKLPEFKSSILTSTRDSLLKPIGGGTETPTAP